MLKLKQPYYHLSGTLKSTVIQCPHIRHWIQLGPVYPSHVLEHSPHVFSSVLELELSTTSCKVRYFPSSMNGDGISNVEHTPMSISVTLTQAVAKFVPGFLPHLFLGCGLFFHPQFSRSRSFTLSFKTLSFDISSVLSSRSLFNTSDRLTGQ